MFIIPSICILTSSWTRLTARRRPQRQRSEMSKTWWKKKAAADSSFSHLLQDCCTFSNILSASCCVFQHLRFNFPLLRIHLLHQGSLGHYPASNVQLAFMPACLTPSATKIICRTFRMRGSAFCAQKNTIFYSCCKIQSMSLSLSDALVRYRTE